MDQMRKREGDEIVQPRFSTPLQNGWGRDSAASRGVPLVHNPDERKRD